MGVNMSHSDPGIESGIRYKKCPECFSKLPLDATRCSSCGEKISGADKFGIAKKPFNWKGYGAAIVLWIVFGYFFWWAFLRE